eukprot:403344151
MESHQSLQRLQTLSSHLTAEKTDNKIESLVTKEQVGDDKHQYNEIIDHQPNIKVCSLKIVIFLMQTKLDYFNKLGWGYADSRFEMGPKNEYVTFSGDRYPLAGKKMFTFIEFGKEKGHVDFDQKAKEAQKEMTIDAPVFNHEFLQELGQTGFSRRSFLKAERIMHSHGQTIKDTFTLRYGNFVRCVDVVLYPLTHEQTERIVQLACKHGVVIIPYGAGSNVTNALECRPEETRMIVSLDMSRMNKIKWINPKSMMACVEAGMVGGDLERQLQEQGFVCGHEPDSVEFSTLGGWISTRASGMKKNKYGNIEDIVVSIRFVTPQVRNFLSNVHHIYQGTFEPAGNWPRFSSGPDFRQVIMGHEGNLGVVTEAVIKIKKKPEVKRFGSILFPDFESGIKFMNEVGFSGIRPASVRLVDNLQFFFGRALVPDDHGVIEKFLSAAKKFYIINVKGFDVNKMCAATLVFEGVEEEVLFQENQIYAMASRYGGYSAGEDAGKTGYTLTFVITYIRDFVAIYKMVCESFETSVDWEHVSSLCKVINESLVAGAKKYGIREEVLFITNRVTQVYDTGAAVYSYFGFVYDDWTEEKALHVYEEIEKECKEATFKHFGCLSHHHGIGKIRKMFSRQAMGSQAYDWFMQTKQNMDPKNIFATDNIISVKNASDKEVSDIEKNPFYKNNMLALENSKK